MQLSCEEAISDPGASFGQGHKPSGLKLFTDNSGWGVEVGQMFQVDVKLVSARQLPVN